LRMIVFVLIHLLLFPASFFRLICDIKLVFTNMRIGIKDEQSRRSHFTNF
jgi:hypothetical protein